jgi:flagellar hook assembly protein FlgD
MVLVVDAQGRSQRVLLKNASAQGNDSIVWDGRDDRGHELPPGTYFVQLRVSGEQDVTHTEKVVLAR